MPIRDERSLEEAARLLREGEELEGEMVVAEAWGVARRATHRDGPL